MKTQQIKDTRANQKAQQQNEKLNSKARTHEKIKNTTANQKINK